MINSFIKYDFLNYEKASAISFNRENRKINHGHLNKIKKQLLTAFDLIPPITGNMVTNHIVDGQHRLEAYLSLVKDGSLPKDTLLKAMYVNIPVDEETSRTIDANTNSKNWSVEDYIESYIKKGVVSYVKLNDWCMNHLLTSENGKSKFRYGAAMIKKKGCQNELKEGKFEATDEEFLAADEIHAELLEITELFGLKGKGSWLEALAISWAEIREQHDFREWMKEFKVKKQKLMKLPKTNQKEWNTIFATVHMAIDKKKVC